MRIELGREDAEAEDRIPPKAADGSKIGVNYTDAYLKAIDGTLEGGGKVSCRRRGLKLTLKIGDQTGTGLMRRLEHGPDPKKILRKALEEAATDAGATFSVEGGVMVLEM